jgi:hypothetical protein
MALVLKSTPPERQKEFNENDEPIEVNAINFSPVTETVQGVKT